MVEHTAETMPGTVEVTRPVAPGAGLVRADEDVAAGAVLVPAGRPLRAPDLGLLAAAGVTSVAVHARPRVGDRLHRRRGGAAGDRGARGRARCATRPPRRWPGWSATPAASRCRSASCPTTAAALEAALRDALAGADLVVVSAGFVGRRPRRDRRGGRRARRRSGATGWPSSPGKPTLLAECGGVPVVGLPGNPLSALVVFRLVGVPLVWRLAGADRPPPEPIVRARLEPRPAVADRPARRRAGAVADGDGVGASRCSAPSALLSVLTAADGYLVVPEDATGLDAGTEVEVILYR